MQSIYNAQTLFAIVDRLTNPPTQICLELLLPRNAMSLHPFLLIKLKALDTSIFPLQIKMLDHYLV